MRLSKNIYTLKDWLNRQILVARQQMQFHPAVQLYVWVCLVLFAHAVKDFVLMTLAALILLLALSLNSVRFINLLSRTRWILISILLIYAYATPGEPLWERLGMFSPASEGLLAGIGQLFRLLTILAGLSILLSSLSPSQLLSGLYSLLLPLRILGLSRERVAVRLALTLKYAEAALQQKTDNWTGSLEHLLTPVKFEPDSMELYRVQYASRDLVLLAGVSAVLLGVWF